MTAITLSPSAFLPRANMAAALALLNRVVERRNTIPILSNVLMQSDADGVFMQGTDLDMALTARIPDAMSDDAFAVTFPAHLAHDIAKRSDAADLTVTDTGNERARLDLGGSQTALQTLPLTDWPSVVFSGDVTAEFDIPADVFRAGLDKVAFAISTEETRYYLNGIYMHTVKVDGRRIIRLVATDGHRLARHDLCDAPDGKDWGVIIPRKAVSTLMHMLKPVFTGTGKSKARVSPDNATVTVNCVKARITFGGYELVTKLVDGTYPDYGRVIPSSNDISVTVETGKLARLIDQVSTISSERGRAVKLDFDAGLIMASVTNPDAGTASDMINAMEHDGKPLTIGFNAKYLLDILVQMPETVRIKLADAGSPTVFTGAAGTLYVLMPMRV